MNTGHSTLCGDRGVHLSDSFRYIVLQRQGHGHFTLLSYQEKVVRTMIDESKKKQLREEKMEAE